MSPNIKFGKFNIDKNQDIVFQYNVMSIPTSLVFKNSKVVDKKVGYGDKEDFK